MNRNRSTQQIYSSQPRHSGLSPPGWTRWRHPPDPTNREPEYSQPLTHKKAASTERQRRKQMKRKLTQKIGSLFGILVVAL